MDIGVRLILVTAPPEEAPQLARRVVEEGLAACVNLVEPVRSVFRWQGAVLDATEALLVMKTSASMVPALRARIEQLHSYEVPEFLVLPIEGGAERYLKWVLSETGGEG